MNLSIDYFFFNSRTFFRTSQKLHFIIAKVVILIKLFICGKNNFFFEKFPIKILNFVKKEDNIVKNDNIVKKNDNIVKNDNNIKLPYQIK